MNGAYEDVETAPSAVLHLMIQYFTQICPNSFTEYKHAKKKTVLRSKNMQNNRILD